MLNSALTRPLYPQGDIPGNYRTGGWVGPRANLDAEPKRTIPCPCCVSNVGHPARSLVTILTELSTLHYSDALSHTVLLIQRFLSKKKTPVLEHTPWPPTQASCYRNESLVRRVTSWVACRYSLHLWRQYGKDFQKLFPALLPGMSEKLEGVCKF